MRASSQASPDSAAAVSFGISWQHPDDVAEVRAEEGFRLSVRFFNGTAGVVELADLVLSDHAGVFAALRHRDTFAAAHVAQGTVAWPGDIDLAPDAMYCAFRECGRWVPS